MNMRAFFSCATAMFLALLAGALPLTGQIFRPLSRPDASQPRPAGGGGDSALPILSPDGRFVVFASTANNLALTTNQAPSPARFPAVFNVFLRDRNTGSNTLVSVNRTGLAGGDGDSLPSAVSSDGRFVCFESSATDLISGDTNNATDVFVRDMVASTTILVSIGTNGAPGNGISRNAAMNSDGHFVAFVSAANNLVPGDNNRIADIFVRDLQAGTTVRASAGATSTLGTGSCDSPELSADGRYVAFFSTATNLVSGVPAGGDIYLRDLVAGTTVWASTGARAAMAAAQKTSSAVSFNLSLSADGRYLAYEAGSSASPGSGYPGLILRYSLLTGVTDLVHTNAAIPNGTYQDAASLQISPDGRFIAFVANTNNTTTTCIQLWDAAAGACSLVSGDPGGNVTANSTGDSPTLDATGRFVAFLSTAANLTTDINPGGAHLYVRDMLGGTVMLDADPNGIGSFVGAGTAPVLSSDGRFAAFECLDSNLVPEDRNHESDVFVFDLLAGSVELASAHDPTLPSVNPAGSSSVGPASADGRYVVFTSDADDLVPGDTNNCGDVFVRDLATGTNLLLSAGTNGSSADRASGEPAINADGRLVVFSSGADNLVPGDNNNARDVFFRDLLTGATTLVSFSMNGPRPANKASYSPLLSGDGRFVLFRSLATDLALGSYLGENLFLRDMQTGIVTPLSSAGLYPVAPVMSLQGQTLYATGSLSATVVVWDGPAFRPVYTNTVAALFGLAITADGSRIALSSRTSTTSYLSVFDLSTRQNIPLESNNTNYIYQSLRFSRDGHSLACVKAPYTIPGTNQVYLFDVTTRVSTLVSHAYGSTAPGYGRSDSPDLGADGRFIAYRSAADNLVTNDNNGLPDLFLYDRSSGLNTLLTVSSLTGLSGDNRSLAPVFSGDGQTLFFQSWASDLAPLDFNQSSDLFAFTLLYAQVIPALSPDQGPWLSWPWVPDVNYRVEYKDNIDAPAWTDLSHSFTNQGAKAWLQDPSPAGARRFYRVLAN